MKSKRVPLRWLVASLLPSLGARCWLFGCWVVWCPGLGLGLGKVFLDFLFFASQQSWTFFGAVFSTKRMWAAGGNTQYKSHLDLCHAFNWLLWMQGASTTPSPVSRSLARLPSISYEIEFGGQRLKNTSGKVCAGMAWLGEAWLASWLPVPGSWATAPPAFCQQLKANFSGRHLRDFQSQLKTNFAQLH